MVDMCGIHVLEGDVVVGDVADQCETGLFVRVWTLNRPTVVNAGAPLTSPARPGIYYARHICEKWCVEGIATFSSRVV